MSTPERRRHLIDPAAPRRTASAVAAERSLTRVQRWVMSALAVTTIAHFAAGLVLAAVFLDDPRPGARVGLCLLAGASGVMGVASALAIHRRSLLSPWLLLGLTPTVVGLWLVLG
ncbi:hypothetical protein GCM10009623_30040 [Nocardioides aestuarii]|uniref:DUF3649 domain-containing protein n=1 Tax=Nocardioides aestuarii TaxID=252231 RepID=A0ABW4TNC6_9ACTN